MRTRVQKWGNSLAIRIPKPFAEQVGLRENGPVDVSVVDGRVLIETPTETEVTLDELLTRVTDENRHGETDWGPGVGNEAW